MKDENLEIVKSAIRILAEYIDAKGKVPGWDSALIVVNKILSPTNFIVYPSVKCTKCGAEWCDHTNIETWEQEFYRLLTRQGETGRVFNNPQWNAYPEEIIRILKNNYKGFLN